MKIDLIGKGKTNGITLMESSRQPDEHEAMWAVCRKLSTDFEPYGDRSGEAGQDCSSGCRHFVLLGGRLAFNWGVCTNPNSPRAGMLTFKHQGCPEFEPEEGAAQEPISAAQVVEYTDQTDESELRIVPIKWLDIETAMSAPTIDDRPSHLNVKTGEVEFPSDDFDLDEDDLDKDAREELDDDWIEIEPIDSRTGYKIMERFALSQTQVHVKKMLLEALSGSRPFRRFKDVVHSNRELRDQWDAFETEAQREAVEDWLAAYGIKPEWTDIGKKE